MPLHPRRAQLLRVLGAQPGCGDALEGVHDGGHGDLRRVEDDEQVHLVGPAVELGQFASKSPQTFPITSSQKAEHPVTEDAAPVPRNKDQMHARRTNLVPAMPVITIECRSRMT